MKLSTSQKLNTAATVMEGVNSFFEWVAVVIELAVFGVLAWLCFTVGMTGWGIFLVVMLIAVPVVTIVAAVNSRNKKKAAATAKQAQAARNVSQVKSLMDQGAAAYNAHNYAEAVRVWKLADSQGSTVASYNMGVYYRDVEHDAQTAERWFRRSAGLGYAKANDALRNLVTQ